MLIAEDVAAGAAAVLDAIDIVILAILDMSMLIATAPFEGSSTSSKKPILCAAARPRLWYQLKSTGDLSTADARFVKYIYGPRFGLLRPTGWVKKRSGTSGHGMSRYDMGPSH
jgi:hypothetical protein